jgi:hypothetical protein
MKKSNLFSYKFIAYLFCLSILIVFLNDQVYSKTPSKPKYSALFDSVKTYYGDTCYIGVNSELIKHLYKYKNYKLINNYLNSYESVKKNIEKFRKIYIKSIYSDVALLLDLSKIFTIEKQQNIVNVAGIYLGPDSVTNIGLSYIILRCSPSTFFSKLYQVNNFDKTFKKELSNFRNDWYKSLKLKEINPDY